MFRTKIKARRILRPVPPPPGESTDRVANHSAGFDSSCPIAVLA